MKDGDTSAKFWPPLFLQVGMSSKSVAQPTRLASDRFLAHRSRSCRPAIGGCPPGVGLQHSEVSGIASAALQFLVNPIKRTSAASRPNLATDIREGDVQARRLVERGHPSPF